jgi:transcriptional regulator with XRE-family HTH domain
VRTRSKKRGRQEAGGWLKGLREHAGLSQRELAKAVGAKYYSFIAQVECGFSRLPITSMKNWARELGVPAPRFARQLLSYYEPELYRLLFKVSGVPRFEADGDDEGANFKSAPRKFAPANQVPRGTRIRSR